MVEIYDGRSDENNLLSKLSNWIISHGDYVFALSAYIIITIVYTWPLAANFATFVNGFEEDIFHELWYLRVGATAPFGPFFLFYTKSVAYPYGVPLFFQVLSPLHSLIFMGLTPLVGIIPAYNAIYMFTFVGSAFTMYIFVNYLTSNKYAAFLSGVIFGFAPIHGGEGLAHLNIMGSELIPLFALFFTKLLREKKMRNAIYAGALIVLNAMIDLHMFLMVFTVILSLLLYYLIMQRKTIIDKGFLVRMGVMGAFAAILGSVVYFQTLYGLIFVPSSLGSAAATFPVTEATRGRSVDLLEFFLPSATNPFFGKYTAPFYARFLGFHNVQGYIGLTALGLALVGIIAFRKNRQILAWGFVALVGFLLALGPLIEVNGKITPIPGPWLIIYYLVPLFDVFRTPYRFGYVLMLGIAVLAGYGVVEIFSRMEKKGGWQRNLRFKKILVISILTLLVLVEFIPFPYPETSAAIPQFYTQVLANDHSNYTVLEVPFLTNEHIYLYYQTAYNKPLINGHISRAPQAFLSFPQTTPFINELGYYTPSSVPKQDIINETYSVAQLAPYILSEYHIKYIILHKDLMSNSDYSSYVTFLTSILGMPYYQDNELTVFMYNFNSNVGLTQYSATTNGSMFSLLYGSWYPLIRTHAHHGRAMSTFAGLDLFSSENQYVQLEFNVSGISGNFPLQLTVNGELIGTYLARNGNSTTYTTPFFPVNTGENQITFTSVNGCGLPPTKNPYGIRTTASRCVSAHFNWIDPISQAEIPLS